MLQIIGHETTYAPIFSKWDFNVLKGLDYDLWQQETGKSMRCLETVDAKVAQTVQVVQDALNTNAAPSAAGLWTNKYRSRDVDSSMEASPKPATVRRISSAPEVLK